MMSPTLILEDDQVLAGLGSAGSNRIRSAVLQTTLNLLAGVDPQGGVIERQRGGHRRDGTTSPGAEPGPRGTSRLPAGAPLPARSGKASLRLASRPGELTEI